ncbi:hypothetical protein LCGC14_2143930 [marine sediment metagenome]|uniref:Uncharacterized protein n=1 Tax=marine sediment metagenome TaxID=412755 RepID=A0A0F9DXX2_9ZZZZ
MWMYNVFRLSIVAILVYIACKLFSEILERKLTFIEPVVGTTDKFG